MIKRRSSRRLQIGRLFIGGLEPIAVQSMCNTDTRNIEQTVKQINCLEKAGCEIIRVAVPDLKAAKCLGVIKRSINLPLVADIHFSHELALEAIKQGVDKIRINPGNIGSETKVKQVAEAARAKNIPIRVGVNSGSLEKSILAKHNHQATAAAMVESALKHIQLLEKFDFDQIVVSLKASDLHRTAEAYSLLAEQVDYPFHIGVTEAGPGLKGTVWSTLGIGFLLQQGLGDTVRVSLTDDPIAEVKTAWEILKALDLRKRGVTITSCPTCGRTEIDLISLVKQAEEALADVDKDIHVAIMGCLVNGPGEAREADLAVIGGRGQGLILRRGQIVKRVQESDLIKALVDEVKRYQ
ncbi:MAG TPA: flavodoxin-dependent (E)-4-hydroxy-3-methylbut-2-enyl-diphosphate synthase [Candidatus Pacearchaeota archaeon]|nr:flavodoxin-dependent (E)-4-hydroxy-3-methylbut-2-enyl-diphosphate synthase [Candidatus Pacearchaeota archaeon]